MEFHWLTVIPIAVVLWGACWLCGYVSDRIELARLEFGKRHYDVGYKHGKEDGEKNTSRQVHQRGVDCTATWCEDAERRRLARIASNGCFTWLTRDEIADEVNAERRAAMVDRWDEVND